MNVGGPLLTRAVRGGGSEVTAKSRFFSYRRRLGATSAFFVLAALALVAGFFLVAPRAAGFFTRRSARTRPLRSPLGRGGCAPARNRPPARRAPSPHPARTVPARRRGHRRWRAPRRPAAADHR